MLIAFCPDVRLQSAVRSALSPTVVQTCCDWQEYTRHASRMGFYFVVIEWLEGKPLQRLEALTERKPVQPIVVVTRGDLQNAKWLKHLVVEEVIWLHEMDNKLPDALRRARSTALLVRLASVLESAEHLPPRLRAALRLACRLDRPLTSVNELARLSGVSRTTLWREWSGVGALANLRLEDFIHWQLLVRAVGWKDPDRSWHCVAVELRIHPHTLARPCKRLSGISLRQLFLEPPRLSTAPACRLLLRSLLAERAETFCYDLQHLVVDGRKGAHEIST